MQTWTVEWGGGAQLSRDGVSRDTLKAGDHVIVSAIPGATPPNTGCVYIASSAIGWLEVVGVIQ